MTQGNLKVLVVEDNSTIATQLGNYLARVNWIVDYAANGHGALLLAGAERFDVVILDLNLPDMDGIEVCRRLKQQQSHYTPVLMLTARDTIDDKIEGLATGADDYVTKPFSLKEVQARCQVLARRHLLHTARVISIGPLQVCRQSRMVRRAGLPILLSDLDFQLLMLLVEASPRTLSRSELLDKLWGEDRPDSDVLKTHMYTLRQALDKPFAFNMIKTIHGIGYSVQGAA
jgi:DNA-binding response OmpR family regulator